MRTKEGMVAYQKARREKLKGVVLPVPIATSKVCAAKEHICESCVSLRIENKKLIAKVSLLELQIKKGVNPDPLPTGDSADDLFARNVAAKNARFSKIGMMAHP
jgi:hypothetical protein